MAFQIKGLDLDGNPKTNSWMGLSRDQARILARVFIFAGILFMLPPFVPDPTDFVSIWLAKVISTNFNMDLAIAYASTFIIGILLFLFGIWIFPYNTKSLFNGYMTKAKKALRRYSKNPIYIVIFIVMLYVLFQYYKSQV